MLTLILDRQTYVELLHQHSHDNVHQDKLSHENEDDEIDRCDGRGEVAFRRIRRVILTKGVLQTMVSRRI